METFGAFAARLEPIDATTERYVANALRVLSYEERATEQIDLFVSEAAKNVLLGYQLVEVADGMYRITEEGRRSIRRTDEQTLIIEGPCRWAMVEEVA